MPDLIPPQVHAQIVAFYLALTFVVAIVYACHTGLALKAARRAIVLENRRKLLSKAYGKHIPISDPRVHRTMRPTSHITHA